MRTGRILGGLTVATAAAGVASAVYQAMAEARDRRRQSPPWRLVDVGGYQLHIVCAGRGGPPVGVCPALGASWRSWLQVQQALAHESTVCLYDRAGLGWSEPPRRRRTAATMAEELHALLHAAGIEPPYVLVGHSLGELITRMFVLLYPDEVTGLALIDSSHPEQPGRLPRTSMRDYPGGKLAEVTLMMMAHPLGVQRLAHDLGIRKQDPDWARHRRADAAELLAFDAICRDTSQLGTSLGTLPLAVATSCELDPNYPADSRDQRSRSRFYQGWRVLQNELPALSTSSTHIVADHGGHHLNRDNPPARRQCHQRTAREGTPADA
jgi:pimeloyl-ACP methyl ester carboxylesterase